MVSSSTSGTATAVIADRERRGHVGRRRGGRAVVARMDGRDRCTGLDLVARPRRQHDADGVVDGVAGARAAGSEPDRRDADCERAGGLHVAAARCCDVDASPARAP